MQRGFVLMLTGVVLVRRRGRQREDAPAGSLLGSGPLLGRGQRTAAPPGGPGRGLARITGQGTRPGDSHSTSGPGTPGGSTLLPATSTARRQGGRQRQLLVVPPRPLPGRSTTGRSHRPGANRHALRRNRLPQRGRPGGMLGSGHHGTYGACGDRGALRGAWPPTPPPRTARSPRTLRLRSRLRSNGNPKGPGRPRHLSRGGSLRRLGLGRTPPTPPPGPGGRSPALSGSAGSALGGGNRTLQERVDGRPRSPPGPTPPTTRGT